jgi:hypothetical protein
MNDIIDKPFGCLFLLTVSAQAIRAALANPVEALKYGINLGAYYG